MTVDGMDLHIRLTPNHKLFGPALVVERRNGNLNKTRTRLYGPNKCHFTGEIPGHEMSRVALSTCKGLTGMFSTDKGHYFIEPVRNHDMSSSQHQPHLVYKKSALPDDMHMNGDMEKMSCGVEDAIQAEKDRERWEKLNRKKRSEPESAHHRSKRSYSVERHVETLIVADKSMVDYYKNDNLEFYILTIMNMVSTMYHDSTIGNAINLVLVKLMFLEKDEKGLTIMHHADRTLKSFCKWQDSINPKGDKNPHHHDVALLITRKNICARMNEPCSTLGLAQVSGLCQHHRTCSINEDTGLSLAYTVAHELGHNFGMHHDNAENGCNTHEGGPLHIMAPQLLVNSYPLIWSNCSRKAVTRFLDRDWGFCLSDEPAPHQFKFPHLPPGVMYDVNHQCRLQYGHDAEYCEGIDDSICSALWCRLHNRCLTRLEPAIEGTLCGTNKWCSGGKCVEITESPERIDGQWGEWGSWTECTRTCGAGVRYSERHCNNPPPSNGGDYCLSERKRYKICSTDACPENQPDFRAVQCAEFNEIPYKGKTHKWSPVPTPSTPCQLHCRPDNLLYSVMLRDMVEDGTPCRTGYRDMCISGRCSEVGCDWQIESRAVEDQCGVCYGDNSSCTKVEQEFKKKRGRGYVEATIIPAGARNIRIEEVAEANNFLAVKSDKGDYYLNGDWYIQWSGDYDIAGTTMHYEREGNKESFSAIGPLKEPIHIMLLFQSQNPGVKFEYTVPNKNGSDHRERVFMWVYEPWTHCTESCGGGYQDSGVACVEKDSGMVQHDKFCSVEGKLEPKRRVCNAYLCPATWWAGHWQHCSATCGDHGNHRRTVICVRAKGSDEQIALEDFHCEHQKRPPREKPCKHMERCPTSQGIWTTGPWSNACNGDPCGREWRKVVCGDKIRGCDSLRKPASSRRCERRARCGQWRQSIWLTCSKSCGAGIQTRRVRCTTRHCNIAEKPSHQRFCNLHKCPSGVEAGNTQIVIFPDQFSNKTENNTLNIIPGVHEGEGNTINVIPHGDTKEDNDDMEYNEDKFNTIGETGADDDDVGHVPSIEGDNHNKTELNETIVDLPVVPSTSLNQTLPNSTSISQSPSQRQTETTNITSTHRPEDNPELKPSSTTPVVDLQGSTTPSTTTVSILKSTEPQLNYRWVRSEWQECTKVCGGGVRKREVICMNATTIDEVDEKHCQGQPKPLQEKICHDTPCLEWKVLDWSECSTTCGKGARTRRVECPLEHSCDLDVKPMSKMTCHALNCSTWVSDDWGECNVSCGEGNRNRSVRCLELSTRKASDQCLQDEKPSEVQKCILDKCPEKINEHSIHKKNEVCEDEMVYAACKVLRRMGRCNVRAIVKKCCRTCLHKPHRHRSIVTT